MPPGRNSLLLRAQSILPEPKAQPRGNTPLHPPSHIPDPQGLPAGCHGERWRGTGRTSTVRGVPARHPRPPCTWGGQGSREKVGFASICQI